MLTYRHGYYFSTPNISGIVQLNTGTSIPFGDYDIDDIFYACDEGVKRNFVLLIAVGLIIFIYMLKKEIYSPWSLQIPFQIAKEID